MLLPVIALVRRVDLAEVIGAALVRRAAGAGHRTIGGELGVPPTTAREWLRRFAARAAEIRAHFTRLAAWLDPSGGAITPRGSPLEDAVEAIGLAAQAAERRFGRASVWPFVSGATEGRLLSNTSSPFPASWERTRLPGDRGSGT